MANNHYVPQFILRNWDKKINVYDLRNKSFLKQVNTRNVFSKKRLYPNELEKQISQKVEAKFSQLYRNKIFNQSDRITLSRDELVLLKKFMTFSLLRTSYSTYFIKNFKSQYEKFKNTPVVCCGNEIFHEKQIENESNRHYWFRTLQSVLDGDGSIESILKNPNSTFASFYWTKIVCSGYTAFWDTSKNTDDFIISDVNATPENEVGWNGKDVQNTKKLSFIFNILTNEKDILLRSILFKQIESLEVFHENFYLFNLSKNRLLVLINPFFKFRHELWEDYKMPLLGEITCFINEKIFSSNIARDGFYTYKPIKLSRGEVVYCNALILANVNKFIGFNKPKKIIDSLKFYKQITSDQAFDELINSLRSK